MIALVGAVLLLASCSTGDKVSPPPPPPSYPKMPSETPTPTRTPSPSANSKHDDLLAVQAVYKRMVAEEVRLAKRGGATKPTPEILATTTGNAQDFAMDGLASLKRKHERMTKSTRVLGVSMQAWTPTKVTFLACEDYSVARWVRDDGTRDTTRNPAQLRSIQTYVAAKTGNRWRISEIEKSTFVKGFQNAQCAKGWYA